MRTILIVMLLILTITSGGCRSGIGVRKAQVPPLLAAWQASAVHDDGLSPRTLQTLRQQDLAKSYENDPAEAFAKLHKLAVQQPAPDILFALAEISYDFGRKLEERNSNEAIACYYLCAGYSYHYLFNKTPTQFRPVSESAFAANNQMEDAFDPRFRLACDLYNNGLAKCIRAAQKVSRLDPRQKLHMPTLDGGVYTLSVTHHGFAWTPEEFGKLQLCSDYRVRGMSNQFKTYGLGVPLICTRNGCERSAPGQAFYPKEVSFPVTAFFRFEGSVADLGARRSGQLELYNPLAIRKIKVARRNVPLETDLTTPLAYFLSRTDLDGIELTAFLRADKFQERTGIYMFEPYQPGKIPVLMVHGLLSSPVTWAPVFNELRADPTLNDRYQFWFYTYPTGSPYLTTAADLRQKLQQLRDELDPGRQDPAFQQTVIVGHSMGGLIGKLLTQDSGDEFWKLVSEKPFRELQADPQMRQKLHQTYFFSKQPHVNRVIFLGTPHRGSKLGPSWAGQFLARMVHMPKHLVKSTEQMLEKNPGFWKTPVSGQTNRTIPTSIDLLNPESPALQLLSHRPAPNGVHYHSIIGVHSGEGTNSNDGVVNYQSAHIDSAESEIAVPAHHVTIHHHPRAILEVRRILHQHLRDTEAAVRTIVPVTTR